MREDAILLYGFADSAERDWFRLLTTVQGVGGQGRAVRAVRAVAARSGRRPLPSGDRASLTRAPGVGARLAVRLLTELRDKAGAMPSAPGFAMPPPLSRRAWRRTRSRHCSTSAIAGPRCSRWLRGPSSASVTAAQLDAVIRDSLKELAQRAAG